MIILHIIPRDAWAQVEGEPFYNGDTLEAEGFIHLSKPTQVVRVANARFRGHPGLQLLVVDSERVTAPIKHEAPYENDEAALANDDLFPHVYGPLNTDAIIAVVDFEPGEDGRFTLPPLPSL